jgi:hypothetical protein
LYLLELVEFLEVQVLCLGDEGLLGWLGLSIEEEYISKLGSV